LNQNPISMFTTSDAKNVSTEQIKELIANGHENLNRPMIAETP